jgi:hypothetical protein
LSGENGTVCASLGVPAAILRVPAPKSRPARSYSGLLTMPWPRLGGACTPRHDESRARGRVASTRWLRPDGVSPSGEMGHCGQRERACAERMPAHLDPGPGGGETPVGASAHETFPPGPRPSPRMPRQGTLAPISRPPPPAHATATPIFACTLEIHPPVSAGGACAEFWALLPGGRGRQSSPSWSDGVLCRRRMTLCLGTWRRKRASARNLRGLSPGRRGHALQWEEFMVGHVCIRQYQPGGSELIAIL